MITCTSERSGIASSGVRSTAYTPAAMMKNVPRSTRNRLRTDHSMTRWSISVRSVAAGSGLRTHDQIRSTARVDEIKVDLLTGLESPEQGRILDAEIHRHRRPL